MKKIIAISLSAFMIVSLAGCDDSFQYKEQEAITKNQEKLNNIVPLPALDNSLERINIKKRLESFDDPNKVSYIYLVSFGKVMSFYTIKGKVTSGNKRLTSNERWSGCRASEIGVCALAEAPELDGTYGQSSPYVFFWTTDGVYVQWSGDYLLVDQPLKFTQAPELIREIK